MWVKVCGIKDCNTAKEVIACNADAIGLNFYASSPRFVTMPDALAIVNDLPIKVIPIGLFVNHSLSELITCCQQLNLQTIQLHGDEPPEFLAKLIQQLPEINIIRAWRIGEDGIAPLADYLLKCELLGINLFACLIDAYVKDAYGGTGETVAWENLNYDTKKMPRLILAGGLNATNVAEAVAIVKPWGVDVASGVESSAGVKDIVQVREFVSQAKGTNA